MSHPEYELTRQRHVTTSSFETPSFILASKSARYDTRPRHAGVRTAFICAHYAQEPVAPTDPRRPVGDVRAAASLEHVHYQVGRALASQTALLIHCTQRDRYSRDFVLVRTVMLRNLAPDVSEQEIAALAGRSGRVTRVSTFDVPGGERIASITFVNSIQAVDAYRAIDRTIRQGAVVRAYIDAGGLLTLNASR